jgi:hypothetical protein
MDQTCFDSRTMNNPLTISTLATSFSVIGITLGAPSLTVLVLYVINAIRLRLTSGTSSSTNFGENPDAILLMLKGITETVGALGRFAGSLGQFIFNGLAVLSVVGLLFGIACWFTGRGLSANAHWARVSAFILIALAMLPSLLLALSLHNVGRVLMLAILTLCAFGIHTLWTGYTPQAP